MVLQQESVRAGGRVRVDVYIFDSYPAAQSTLRKSWPRKLVLQQESVRSGGIYR